MLGQGRIGVPDFKVTSNLDIKQALNKEACSAKLLGTVNVRVKGKGKDRV